ncbi:MAG: dihydroorotate dehydrogenase electron transfer subunit [Candidatus Omnitrophota bacterium]
MKDIKANILSNKEIAPGYFKMALDAPYIAKNAKPGQFVQVRCSDGFDPLLRRPLSIHRVSGIGDRVSGIDILYEVIGKGTEVLSRKKAGETIDILGPLGNGFTLSPSTIHHPPSTIIIAGGIGVAPLIFLAEKLAEIQNPKSKIQNIVLLGARTKSLILCEKDFKKTGAKVYIATDDGSKGYKGLVTKLFEKVLRSTIHDPRSTVCACGPRPMLESIARMCNEKGVECEILLEEKMACGVGACLGCAVKVRDNGYKLACKDGPVFKANTIIWP